LADKLLLALLTPTLLVAILVGWLLIDEQNRHYIISFVVITLIYAWFLMTYPSILLWEHLPLLRKVQFPWRIGIVVDLSVATMCAIWFERVFARKWLFATTFCLIATALAAYYVHNARSMYWGLMDFRKEINASSVEEARRDIIHRMSAPEYLTPWALDTIPAEEAWDLGLLAERLDEVSEVSIVSGAGNVAIVDKQLDELSIVVDALTPVPDSARAHWRDYLDRQLHRVSNAICTRFVKEGLSCKAPKDAEIVRRPEIAVRLSCYLECSADMMSRWSGME
jgi:hypothetical protein